MNIDDYRAMVAEEAQSAQEQQQTDSKGEQLDAQAQQVSTDNLEEVVQAQGETSDAPQDDRVEDDGASTTSETTTEHVEIDGQQISLEELKNGYLRQSDYTRKTQELARTKEQNEIAERYYEAVSSDPEVAKSLAERYNLPYQTPEQARVNDLETRYHDLLLQQEISTLESKYDDFDAQEVVRVAFDKKLPNLEDAYLLTRASKVQPAEQTIDKDALAEQIRQEILNELQSNQDTSSVITSGGSSATVEPSVTLTSAETRVAKMMGLTPSEYSKWSKNK